MGTESRDALTEPHGAKAGSKTYTREDFAKAMASLDGIDASMRHLLSEASAPEAERLDVLNKACAAHLALVDARAKVRAVFESIGIRST